MCCHLPGSNQVDSDTLCPCRTPHASHQCSGSVFGRIVLWRARLVDVCRDACLYDQASVVKLAFWLQAEVMHGKLCGIEHTNEVCLEYTQIWLHRVFRKVWNTISDVVA